MHCAEQFNFSGCRGIILNGESFNAMFLIVIVINENVFHDFIALITILFVTVLFMAKKSPHGAGKECWHV